MKASEVSTILINLLGELFTWTAHKKSGDQVVKEVKDLVKQGKSVEEITDYLKKIEAKGFDDEILFWRAAALLPEDIHERLLLGMEHIRIFMSERKRDNIVVCIATNSDLDERAEMLFNWVESATVDGKFDPERMGEIADNLGWTTDPDFVKDLYDWAKKGATEIKKLSPKVWNKAKTEALKINTDVGSEIKAATASINAHAKKVRNSNFFRKHITWRDAKAKPAEDQSEEN